MQATPLPEFPPAVPRSRSSPTSALARSSRAPFRSRLPPQRHVTTCRLIKVATNFLARLLRRSGQVSVMKAVDGDSTAQCKTSSSLGATGPGRHCGKVPSLACSSSAPAATVAHDPPPPPRAPSGALLAAKLTAPDLTSPEEAKQRTSPMICSLADECEELGLQSAGVWLKEELGA
jgi:hypothetical protein